MEDFKRQYNKFWTQYHLIARYLACPDVDVDSKEKNSHKLNDAELQIGQLTGMAKEYLNRNMTQEEIEFGFFTGWEL